LPVYPAFRVLQKLTSPFKCLTLKASRREGNSLPPRLRFQTPSFKRSTYKLPVLSSTLFESLTGPRTETALLHVLGPSLLTAVAFEHADGAAGLGIQHRPKQRWLLIAIATRLETPSGKQIGRAGGAPVIIPGGPPMHLTATGTEQRRALVLILHDSSMHATTPEHEWVPKDLCKT
jgi:hypothetical protein